VEEWIGEIGTISFGRERAKFTVQMLTGMPHLAATLWWPIRAS
jgi:hypothetical protein